MGIKTARNWGSPNDFKKVRTCDSRLGFKVLTSLQYLGLRPNKTFLEWGPNKEVAAAAEELYGTINHFVLFRLRTPNQLSRVWVSALVTPSLVLSLQIPSLLFVETVSLPLISPPQSRRLGFRRLRAVSGESWVQFHARLTPSYSPRRVCRQQHLRLVPAHDA